MKLSIIIVNFNTKDLLKNCLQSLLENYGRQIHRKFYEVIVVDNASSDNSVIEITEKFPEVKSISSKVNAGFAKANNLGVKKSRGDYLLFLNPDTVVYSETLTTILNYLENHEDVGVATCKVLLRNGELDDASHRGFPTPWRAFCHFSGLGKIFPWSIFFNGYHLGYEDLSRIHEIDACAGAFLMIKRNVGKEIKWFDEDYFWYGDDLDLCYRVKEKGYKVSFIPDVSIMHYKGAASGIKKQTENITKASKETRQLATKARFDVMKIFYKKHYQNSYPKWLQWLVFAGVDLKQKLTELTLR